MIIRDLSEVKTVEWGNGLSRRFVLEEDGLGHTVTDTIVRRGTRSFIEYRNHLEVCYCIGGSGFVEDLAGNRYEMTAGRMYALDKHDSHYLCGGEDEDLRLVCVFVPALTGDEAHDFSNNHASVY